MNGLLYGGVSSTFKAQKKPVINQLNRQRWENGFIEWPMFGNRTSLKVPKNLQKYQGVTKEKDLTNWDKLRQIIPGLK